MTANVKEVSGRLLTSQVEGFIDCLDEVRPILTTHWHELGLYRDKMPLDPAWSYYEQAERRGEILFITLRLGGQLVGYFGGLLGPAPHYQSTLTCKMDVIYLAPEHRGLGIGKILLDATKAELTRRGVKLWWVGSKNHKPIEALFGAYGFEPTETYFSMWIGD